MTDDNNNQNDQPDQDNQQPSDETQPKLREISAEELKQILEDHKKWLESDGKEGEKANFENTNLEGKSGHRANFEKLNLQGTSFRNANVDHGIFNDAILDSTDFQRTILKRANFSNANLTKSDFRKANLTVAYLQNTQLKKANFEKAILINSHLEGAECQDTNFRKANLANTRFTKAKLNRANLQKADLSYIDDLNTAEIQHADLRGATGLLGNEFAQADVTGTKLPEDIKEFKALETVKETSQNARKIFFAMLLGCVYSWLTIATTTDVRLLTNTASSPLPIIGTEIPIAWFYITAPLVLICLFFYFHLYLDNLWGALASLPAIFPDGKRLDERAYPWLLNTLVRRHFKRLKDRPLIARMKEWITIFLAWCVVPFTMMAFWLRYIPRHDWMGTILHIGLIVLSVAFAVIFYRLCSLTLQGQEKEDFIIKKFWGDRRFYYGVSVVIFGVLFSLLSYGGIHGQIPPNPNEERKMNFYRINEIVPWIFKKVGYNVFANFKEKEVSEKPINYWEISEDHHLESVKGANLSNSNLRMANMDGAFLVNADLRNANLQFVSFWGANLQNAKLDNAILLGANLRNVKNLTVDQLHVARTLYRAKLDPELFEQVKKCCSYHLEEPKEETDKTN